jgi:serine protease Do
MSVRHMMLPRFARQVCLVVGLAVVSSGLSAPADARGAPESFADLAAKLLPSVVNISTTQTVKGDRGPELPQLPPGSPFEDFFKEFFDRNRPQGPRRSSSLGSGFLVDKRGYVVTNNHVIQDADEITVILHDNSRRPAKIVGYDPKTDLAVLKIEGDGLPAPLAWGDSDKSRVGDWVVAIGNPFGLGGTVTAGIISARGRDINAGPYDDFLQTDASINRGNSGGPMFNLDGEVIGINTAIFSPSGGSVGIGFAIPSSNARWVVEQLIESGSVKRGWLGVHIQQLTDDIAENLGISNGRGAMVARVIPDGPAEKAGVRTGDVILEFNGREIGEMRRLPAVVAETPVGRSAPMVIWRDKKKMTVEVTVGSLSEGEQAMAATPGSGPETSAGEVTIAAVGIKVADLNPQLADRLGMTGTRKGVVITGITDGGPAAEKNLRPGDVIVEVSQEEMQTAAQVAAKIQEAQKAGQRSVLLLLEGQGGLRFEAVRLSRN